MVQLTQLPGFHYEAPQPPRWNALMQGLTAMRRAEPPANALMSETRASPPTEPQAVAYSPYVGEAPMAGPATGPASIRTNNPGAMWPGPSASRFGGTAWQPVSGGNRIAVFPDAVSGAAAQFDLLGRGYANMTLSDAIGRWSGGNASDAYVRALTQATGMQPNALLTPELLRDPATAVPLARAMAQWEAGRAYPLTDEQWFAAHALAFPGAGR